LRSLPGVGKILALVLRYDLPDIRRFPRVQEGVADGRLVTCAKESAGTRDGTSGKKIGKAYLTWAFSEAAVLFLRHHPAGPKDLTRLAQQPGQGNALTILAHQVARAVSDRLQRDTACDVDQCLRQSWSGAGEPAASRAAEGLSLALECWPP
jgi:transposase